MKYLSGQVHAILKIWKNSRWPSDVQKIGKKLQFWAILAHFMLYLCHNSLNWPEIDMKGEEQVKVTIHIIGRVVRSKMADRRPFWIAENEGWPQTAPTDLWHGAWGMPYDGFTWKQTSSATCRCFWIFNISIFNENIGLFLPKKNPVF